MLLGEVSTCTCVGSKVMNYYYRMDREGEREREKL